jgi:RimJ/RimL family protein N-acetyltransferase
VALRIPRDLSERYTRFGVSIGRLTLAEIEILRQRRNDPAIAQFMIFRDEISPEQQLAWFTSVDNRDNLYGTVYWQGEFIGLTNLRDIDHDACSAEGGMIIWSVEHQNSLVPFRAALVGTDLAFWEYGFQRMTARVLASNVRARRFNRALGYRFDTPPDEHGVVTGWLSNPNYWRATMKLRAVLDEQDGTVNGGVPLPAVIPELPPDD